MVEKHKQVTAEIKKILDKYEVEGAFVALVLKGEASGKKYDDAFYLQGNVGEIIKGLANAIVQVPAIHKFIDLIVLMHTITILGTLGVTDLTANDLKKHMETVN